MPSEDPYYTRKPVPSDIVSDVGYTGLTPQEEHENRERKFSASGIDVRKWGKSKTGGLKPQNDPYYGRKPVPDALIHGVGETGLSPEEEYLNRERKYSVGGVDVRRFSTSATGFLHPTNDPYYGRKPTHKTQTVGIGETNMSPAQEYEVREQKESMFQNSEDPFANLADRHRGSVSGIASGASHEAYERRRSSAVAPDMMAAAATARHNVRSGYSGSGSGSGSYSSGQHHPRAIDEKPELPPANVGGSTNPTTTTTTTTTTHTSSHYPTDAVDSSNGSNIAGTFHDKVTGYEDPNSAIAPHEVR